MINVKNFFKIGFGLYLGYSTAKLVDGLFWHTITEAAKRMPSSVISDDLKDKVFGKEWCKASRKNDFKDGTIHGFVG